MEEEVTMLEQSLSVAQAQQDLREMDENNIDLTNASTDEMREKMSDLENSVITGDQLAKLRMMYSARHTQVIRENEKIGRNDLCPCGSGLKYKKCCMDSGKYEIVKRIPRRIV